MNTEKFIRVTMYFQKKPGMSDDEFNEYWSHIHGPLCIKWMQRYGVIRCAQKHINKPAMKFLKDNLPVFPLSKFDGIEDFYVRDIKDFTDALGDEEYKKILSPDAGKFIDTPSLFLSVGEDYVLIENGEVQQSHEHDYHSS
ncbi:hypothetical protein TWF569_009255 [Orbilia oligospora]|uniref:EthD domain-containing protein n=1 Tax=Orbilia oligospora TaxID=2813651 RepID=A0A7C8JUZ1_ORBOL|nr:hypothetical protein TWF706_006610 [Orbilia oligospora]KAF3099028.1 hypothetical protein TWF706_006610 [Orbilia oligospora]KAF3104830.1 hypothetical protein TWF103_006803 [Orbilia oligospora]KAF3104831.1 hypothetical protein TWF103_006803 [Orbilia oligospora]KAF3109265.1 hypothetical protein TWF102_010037 [Orbilia oligospora]